MANSRTSGEYKEYATVDTAPGSAGYWTNSVSLRQRQITKLFFSLRDGGASAGDWDGTVTLQFKCSGDSDWTDYDTYTSTDIPRKLIEGNAGHVIWRIGVKETEYTSGSLVLGFDW